MDQRVGAFVVEVAGQVVVPVGENVTAISGLQVQRSTPAPVGDSLPEVGPVSAAVGQQVDVDWAAGDWQIQCLVEPVGERFERIKDAAVPVESEFRVDQERTVTLDRYPSWFVRPGQFRAPCQEEGGEGGETDRCGWPPPQAMTCRQTVS